MNEKLKEFVTAVGALAETLTLFHRGLIQNGLDETDALYLTKEFMLNALKTNSEEDN